MTKEEYEKKKEIVTKSVTRKFLGPLRLLQLLSIAVLLSSPFIFIWDTWYYTWRVALSGFLATIIFGLIAKAFENGLKKFLKELEAKYKAEKGLGDDIDDVEGVEYPLRSQFQRRMEQIAKQKGKDKGEK